MPRNLRPQFDLNIYKRVLVNNTHNAENWADLIFLAILALFWGKIGYSKQTRGEIHKTF